MAFARLERVREGRAVLRDRVDSAGNAGPERALEFGEILLAMPPPCGNNGRLARQGMAFAGRFKVPHKPSRQEAGHGRANPRPREDEHACRKTEANNQTGHGQS
jgi:hypothetical protein